MSETARGANYTKRKSRRNYATVPAIDPHDGGQWDLLISPRFMEWVQQSGMGRTKELAHSVRWLLLNPRSVYRGVRDLEREIDDDDWLCYAGIPPTAYDYRTGEAHEPWDGETMLVCVTDERVLYDWWWVKADPDQPHLPIGHQQRFREKVF